MYKYGKKSYKSIKKRRSFNWTILLITEGKLITILNYFRLNVTCLLKIDDMLDDPNQRVTEYNKAVHGIIAA